MQTFPGQGSNPCHSCNHRHSSDNAGSWSRQGTPTLFFLNRGVGIDFKVCQLAILPDNDCVARKGYSLGQIFKTKKTSGARGHPVPAKSIPCVFRLDGKKTIL